MDGPGGLRLPGPIYVYSLGFFRQHSLRRILGAAGYSLRTGWPRAGSPVAVWGHRPVSWRGRKVARSRGARVLTVEDGFLRSVAPGDPVPLSLVLDDVGIYYDASRPSRLENILNEGPIDGDALIRARAGIQTLRNGRLSKYTPATAVEDLGHDYVLVVDQTRNDASIRGGGANAGTFDRMIAAARSENPGRRIVLKQHPEVTLGRKHGHLSADALGPDDLLIGGLSNPWDLIRGAHAVYTVTSQLGYEGILARKPVRTFGDAFYAGWGLTNDERAVPRRRATHDPASLFAACHLAYPIYYDPWRDRLTDFETACHILSTLVAASVPEESTEGEAFSGVRRWKRSSFQRFRPRYAQEPRFLNSPDVAVRAGKREGRAIWHWAAHVRPGTVEGGYVEDGFLRSVGLGARLTHPASLIFDKTGIYYDPTRPSDLDHLIAAAAAGSGDIARAKRLRKLIVDAGVTKYNLASASASPPPGYVLVPGQVEDDASIRLGCGAVRTNGALLQAARAAYPESRIVYKPHPDVEAGLRPGLLQPTEATLADLVAENASAVDLIAGAERVFTLTSLLGFEALLRGIDVTCLGTPFYAGWGLTRDLGPAAHHRHARPTLDQLVWASLIAYPRYVDPGSGLPTTPEFIVEQLATGEPTPQTSGLSRLQDMFRAFAPLWR